MSWDRAHRRHQLVHAVLDDIAATGQPSIPVRWRAEVDAEFGSLGDFLREVQLRWYRAFEARLDALLEDPPWDMHAGLVRLWHDLADAMPAARFLLDSHLDHPTPAALDEHYRRRLYQATGVHLDPAALPRHTLKAPRPPCLRRVRLGWRTRRPTAVVRDPRRRPTLS